MHRSNKKQRWERDKDDGNVRIRFTDFARYMYTRVHMDDGNQTLRGSQKNSTHV